MKLEHFFPKITAKIGRIAGEIRRAEIGVDNCTDLHCVSGC